MKRNIFRIMLIITVSVFGLSNIDAYALESSVVDVNNPDELFYAAENCRDGDILTLSADIYTEKTLYFDLWNKTATLDLNGHNLEIKSPMSNAIRINGFGSELTITDSKSTGKLTAMCLYDARYIKDEKRDTAAIRVSSSMQTLILDGVTVEAVGGAYGPGIGAVTVETGNIIIKNSDVSANGGVFGAGIGGGFERMSGNIMIESGNIAAKGGDFAAAIGTGGFTSLKSAGNTANTILISGGNILAQGGLNAAGIGGGQLQVSSGIKIEDGKITAFGGSGGAGIGTGKMSLGSEEITDPDSFTFESADIFINGGNIKANGGTGAAGIGTGEGSLGYLAETVVKNRLIKIDGGNIVTSGGMGGAGVGGGAYFSGGKIEVAQTGAKTYLDATGGVSGAGVGGGLAGLTGSLIRVYDGRIFAHGGDNAAGIGSGEFSLSRMEPVGADFIGLKNIVVTGGELTVTAGKNAAAIGGGNCGSGSDVVFAGPALVRAESEYENSIGAGMHAVSHGSVTIDGGNIIVNNKMGAIPRNSQAEPLYEGEIRVVSSILDMPLENVEIQADLTEYKYKAVTESDGSARVYFPRNECVALEVFSNTLKTASTSAQFEGENLEIVLDEKKVKILSKEYTHFADGKDNTFQIEYAGGTENMRFALGGDTDIAINAQTGLMTFPVQLKEGNYDFPVLAYSGDTLLDTVDFQLSVVESLAGVTTSEYSIQTEINKSAILRIDPEPEHSAVSEVFWKVTANDNEGIILKDKYDETGEYCAEFSARRPGKYAVTASAVDSNKNTASKTFEITVSDPYAIDTRAELSATRAANSTQSNPPEINAWLVERITDTKVYIDFYASCAGKYFYEAVKAGGKRTEQYTGGYTAFEGNNRIECDLPDAGAYEFYVVIEDNVKNVSEASLIYVDEFTTPDIIPPELSDFKVIRANDSATVSFVANKEGYFKYAAYEDGISTVSGGNDFSLPSPMNEGLNTFTIKKLDGGSFCDIVLAAHDLSENSTPKYAFTVESYYEPVETGIADGINITASAATAVPDDIQLLENSIASYAAVSKNTYQGNGLTTGVNGITKTDAKIELYEDFIVSGGDSVMIGIVSSAPGEYFYGVSEGGLLPQIDESHKGALLSEGKNAIQLTGLENDKSYRVGITAKNEDARSELIVVNIPAEKPGINLTGLSAKRESASRASFNFYSDKDGIINYALMREGDGIPESYNRTEIIYEGRNKIYVDDIIGNEKVYLVAVAQDKGGRHGEFLRIDIGAWR